MCELCGKKPVFAVQVAHDRMYVTGRSNRKVKPNIQKRTVQINGVQRQIKVCTRCMRTMDRKNRPRR